MGFLQRLFGAGEIKMRRSEARYRELMAQSRQPDMYGEGRFPDTYNGRVDVLTMHMAVYMDAIRNAEQKEGIDTGPQNQNSYSQKLFDEMVKDFDFALREEGYTDTGVKKRIKPIVGFFYKRLKTLTESLDDLSDFAESVGQGSLEEGSSEFAEKTANYLIEFGKMLNEKTQSELVNDVLKFPDL